jgi:uncharacterized integral membrane protein
MTVATTGDSKRTGGSRSRTNGAKTGSSSGSTTTRRRQTRARTVSASIGEPTATVPVDDSALAAANARRALNPDMPRVAWLRSQLQQMESRQRERLLKTAQLTVIAIVFITFVLQNAEPVNVHFLLFSLDIRLIWVIFGCGMLGGAAGYLIGRPDKSLRALLPQKPKKPTPEANHHRRPATTKR